MSELLTGLVAVLVIGYLPGALLFRWPVLQRQLRAALAPEERVFWQVMLSLSWSLLVVLGLAALSVYSFPRLIAANLVLSGTLLAVGRGRLRWRGTSAKLSASAILPILLVATGVWRFFPASEYVIGGKDPGVYINEGFQIARTGTLFRQDAVVAAIPASARELFVRSHDNPNYYGLRFMGVFVNDPATGSVIAGFPHLYPASIAIGYGVAGAAGATNMVAVWAVLGLLAVYFLGARLLGRLPAFAAGAVLALNVVEAWYGRYPNTEIAMQALLFATLLAVARAHQDADAYFGWAAGTLIGLQLFMRFDAFLAAAAIGGALAVTWVASGTRPRWGLVVPLAAAGTLALIYYNGPMTQYYDLYRLNLPSTPALLGALVAAGVAIAALSRIRRAIADPLNAYLPLGLAILTISLAVYALVFRHPSGLLTSWDAYSVRTFRDAYVFWPVLIAAVFGVAMSARAAFWRDPAFFLTFVGFAIFFFYKIRIVPEQFWMARRFVPIILPGVMLFAAAAAFGVSVPDRRRTLGRVLAGGVFMTFVGWQYVVAAAPVAAHHEYRGAIRQVELLADQFTPHDLVIVEARNAGSDYHVLAMPLAYLHGLQVLVLESPRPDRRLFEAFLTDALTKYDRVLFLGGGGTDLLSRRITATPVAFTSLDVPEYETVWCCSTADEPTTYWDHYPKEARRKDLGYSVFQFALGGPGRKGFALDVGYLDDLNVVRFHAREVFDGRTFRWTTEQSFIAATGMTGDESVLALVMNAGGRPPAAEPATVQVFFNDVAIGRVTVTEGFNTYSLRLPPEAVRAAASSDDPAQIRLLTNPWRPSEFNGGPDTRALGVMLERVEIH